MKTTPTPPRSVVYRAYFISLILILTQFSTLKAQCDAEVSGVLTYCFAQDGANQVSGYMVGFRVNDPTGDTLNVVDLLGNNVTNRGKRINDINTEAEPATITVVPLRISGVGADTLEYWYFGPYANGDSFDIVLVDPNNVCDTIFVAAGEFDCMDFTPTTDPGACAPQPANANPVPLYFLDFSFTEFTFGGGGGGNENFDEVFLIMQRSREDMCCDIPNSSRCFEFIVRLNDQDIGLAIDDVGSGSTGGSIYADSLNGFTCTGDNATTWPFQQTNGQSGDIPLCLPPVEARDFVVLSCKPGNNVTGASIDAISNIFAPPEATIEPCNVSLQVFNVDSAFWSSPDDPNLDNLISCNGDSLFCTFFYDSGIFGDVTVCSGDTFTYIVGGVPAGNQCLSIDTILYDTTYVVVYPVFTVEIDTFCNGSGDSLIMNAIVTSPAAGCPYQFDWSNGATTQTITVPFSNTEYFLTVTRSDLPIASQACVQAMDSVVATGGLSIICTNIVNQFFTCVNLIPDPDTALVDFTGCGNLNPFVFVEDVENNGSGCQMDTFRITRYYIVDFDGDTINTTTDRDTCIQILSATDNIPPVITSGCPPNVTVSCTGQIPAPNTGSITATDNCSSTTITHVGDVISNQTCPNRYTVTRTYRATDVCGNSTTCAQIINVNDQTPPSITCPMNVTVSCIGNVPAINITTVTATDNCGGSVTIMHVSDNITGTVCTNRLTITRVYRATDACGNSATCSQIITVNDQTPPSITCPAPVTVMCAAQVPAPNIGSVISSDNCGGSPTVTFVNDVTTNQTCVNRYTLTRTYRATDVCGNSATCTQTITVNDITPPSITCPAPVTVSCANMVPTPNPGGITASDNCNGIPTITHVGDVTTNQTCVNRYTLTRTYMATDECGNSTSCTQVITINDLTPPSITCPAPVTVSCASLVPAVNTSSVTSSDNCGGNVTIAHLGDVTTNQSCTNRYTITRTYRATDACLNTATCTQIITVFDGTAPQITCPAGVTVQCASQIPAPNPASVTATDNCNGVPVITFVNDVTSNQTCVNRFTVTRTYRATDECGNSASCTQTITVFDNTIPTITCPGPVTVQCAAQVPAPNPGAVTASDNCNGIPTITFIGDVTSNQTCVNRYTITRAYRATDECGNSASCTQTITVFDNTIPTITCPANVTFSCASQVPAPNPGSVTASDNCNGIPTVTFVNDVTTNQTCVNRFTVIRTYRATDECGNSATCSHLITVNDITPPGITCPAPITVTCASLVPSPNINSVVASDNCNGIPVVTFVNDITSNQTCANRYLVTRTYRATDECGNSATCSQVITVNDITPPGITCPTNVTVTCATDVPAPNIESVTASDNCNGVPTVTHVGDVTTNQTCTNRFTVTRTYRATDLCGNSSTCDQLIFVNDQIVPTITCPANLTVTCTEFIPVPDIGGVTVSDNCSGAISITFVGDVPTNQVCANNYTLVRTYRATDVCGNSATCNQLIRVLDQTPPTITCPPPLTVSCANEVPDINIESVTTSDNCNSAVSIFHLGDVISNQVCANRYILTRTYRAVDACNNSASCTQVITVFDNTPPQITCPPDITISTEASTLPPATGTATATDNCGETPSLTYTDLTTAGPCVEEYTINRTWRATDACGNTSTCLQIVEITGGCIVDLSLTKEFAVGQSMNFQPGDNLNFTIRVTNNGNIPIGSVEVTDYIPIGFTLNDPDWIAGTAGSTGQSASVILSIGNGLLPPGGLAPTAFVEIDITLKSDDNLTGGSYTNIAEISTVLAVDGTDISDEDIDSDPDTDDTNDPADEDDHDPLVFCAIIDPVIIGEAIVCQNETSVYTVENFNPEHTYNWAVGDGGIIINSTDSSITVLWIAPAGTLVTITLTEIAGEGCEFTTVFDVLIGGSEALACFDHINLSISDACGTQILSGMILTGDQHGDNSYQVFVIDMNTGDTIPNATVNCTHVGMTFKVSVRSPCTGQSCWGLVTIEDKAPPILACRCSDPSTDENCQLSCMVVDQILNGNIPEQVRPVILDDCCGTTLELTNVELDFADCSDGSVDISWVATDASGNTATCTQSFDIAPLDITGIVWPVDFTGDCDDRDDPENTGWPRLDGFDLIDIVVSCNIWTQYDDQVVPICGDGRKIIRRWTVRNMCNGQTANWIQTILLKDRVGPVLTCSPNITVNTSVWACYATVNMPKPNAVDACSSVKTFQLFSSGGTVVETNGQFRIDNLPIGVHLARWIVTDECYNTSQCLISITVVDNVPPVVSCQSHTVVSLTSERPNGVTLVPAESLNDGSFDNCTNVTFRARRMDSCIDFDWTTGGACVDDIPGGGFNAYDEGTAYGPCIPFACCDVGSTIMVQLEVSDEAGNVNSCMVEVEVQDKIAPSVTCPPTILISCEYPLEIHPGVYSDILGNNDGTLDEDPLSELFGNVYDAFRYPASARQHIIINDPDNEQFHQPHDWGLDGWAVDNCEVELSVTVSVTDDCSGNSFFGDYPAGAVKLIERRFIAYDGIQSGSCVQRIWVIDYDPFFITDSTCTNENPFDGVIWPCDVLVTTCPMEVTNTGEPIIVDDGCSLIGVTYEDTRFDFDDEACFKILREWKVLDWCQFDVNTGYGLWTYTQTIKVADADGAEFLDCPVAPVELCTDDPGITLPANNQLFLGENNPNASSCSVHVNLHHTVRELCSTSIIYDVKLYLFNDQDFIQIKPETEVPLDANHEADIYFDTEESSILAIALDGIPYNDPLCGDYHRLLWSVEDGCGNRTYCDYLFRLEDCKKPTPVCIDGLSTVVMPPSGEVTLFASSFNASSVDDCTPSDELLFSFSGTSYQPSFVYTCDNVPVFDIPFDEEIWVADGGSDDNCNGIIEWSERNTDLCIASLVITDPNEVCDQSGLVLGGEIMTEQTEAVSQVAVNLSGPQGNFPPFVTQDDGKYTFGNLQAGANYTIHANRNDNPMNGVSTLDLVQIQKHLLGKAPFNSAYQYIAADANNNQSVTAIDLIEIRKLILGLYHDLPQTESWRFVQKQEISIPGPPWPLNESISLFDLQLNEDEVLDFVGVKIGDVNHSAKAHFNQITPRNANRLVELKAISSGDVKAGGIVECKIMIPELVAGFQWTFETQGLEFIGVKSNSIPIDESHIGVLGEGVITMSWNGEPISQDESKSISLILQFIATANGSLKDMLHLSNAPTIAEAYTPDGEILDLKLNVDQDQSFTEFALYQNKPNPWDGQTLIEFDLPQDATAKLSVYDIAGKVVKTVEGMYKAGHNSIMLTSHDIPTPGVLYYRLDSGSFSAVKKMMIFH